MSAKDTMVSWVLQRLADIQCSTAPASAKLEEIQKAADAFSANFEFGGSQPSTMAKLSLAGT